MKRFTLKQRLHYYSDLSMSKGSKSLIMLLGIITLLIVFFAGIVVMIVEKSWAESNFLVAAWKSFTLTLDPGNLAGVNGSWGLVAIATLSTLSGIFITSSLIGVIHTGLTDRLEQFRRGNHKVIDSGHTVILGMNESTITILQELITANVNQKRACVVVMDELDRQQMENTIRQRIPDTKSTKIICRSGNTANMSDLEIVSLDYAKSIIISHENDNIVIQVLLALTKCLISLNKSDKQNANLPNIIATVFDIDNFKLAMVASQGHANIFTFSEFISKLIAHVSYQPGLSMVYSDLLDFKGDEIYIESHPILEGISFKKANLYFKNATVIGVKHDTEILLNPIGDYVIKADDEIILISEDDGVSIPLGSPYEPTSESFNRLSNTNDEFVDKDLLIIGFNELGFDILKELNLFLPAQSKVMIAVDHIVPESTIKQIVCSYSNLAIEMTHTQITKRKEIRSLLERNFSNVLILSDSSLNLDDSDAKTLGILLHIRDLADEMKKTVSITTEMQYSHYKDLAEVAKVNDFVLSRNISSLVMAQVSENRHLYPILTDLVSSRGSELYLKPASNYVSLNSPIAIYEVSHQVSTRDEVLIGFKQTILNDDGLEETLLITNPEKSKEISFTERDYLIVLAES